MQNTQIKPKGSALKDFLLWIKELLDFVDYDFRLGYFRLHTDTDTISIILLNIDPYFSHCIWAVN